MDTLTMPTFLVRSAEDWTKLPGNFDALHTGQIFASDNPLGLPVIGNAGTIRPRRLHPYNIRTRSEKNLGRAAVHFFLDDYQFEVAWTRPSRALSYVQRFSAALTPDFSIWDHWPLAAQQWNTYRNRWIGAYWMSQGLTVIPSVSWAGPESFKFAFAGIKWGSTVAISTVGMRSSQSKGHFIRGFLELIERIGPTLILCYGRMPFESVIEVIEFPTYWEERKGHA
ncbi:MAG: hypothetical protein BroJett011_61980 [Chloroflexota bacterium]|nr:MAG: hypothetical protein BroJett011_61980 [Chloroflexota bacterium]